MVQATEFISVFVRH